MKRMTEPELEKDLVAQCQRSAERMGAFLAVVGQRKAKGSGTTLGFPDLVLMCNRQVVLIECKRTKSATHPQGTLNLGQTAFIAMALEHGVEVETIRTVRDFEYLVNNCRRPRGVVRK